MQKPKPAILSFNNDDTLDKFSEKKKILKSTIDSKEDLLTKSAAIVTFAEIISFANLESWKFTEVELCGSSESTKLTIFHISSLFSLGMMVPKTSSYKEIFNIR